MTIFSSLNDRSPNQILEEVANYTLQNWGMMLTEYATPDHFNNLDSAKFYFVSINLKGPHEGSVNIIASRGFAEILHQNLSGDSEFEVSENELVDCLKEMANVTAGRIVTEIFGENAVYDLTDLDCSNCMDQDMQNFKSQGTKIFMLGDDFPVGFSLKL